MSLHEIGLQNFTRVPLAFLPTPIIEAPRLAAAIDGPRLWIKRDDLTGFGFGGNKIRGLEFLLADALAQRADTLITGAAPQSNYVRAAAAAAVHAGLHMVAIYSGVPPSQIQGNYRLTRLLGAEIRFTGNPDRASVDGAIEETARELRSSGRKPYAIPRGGASVLGTFGYVQAVHELAEQCAAMSIVPDAIVLATGSCGTQAGLVAGVHLLRLPWRIEGFTVSRPVDEVQTRVLSLAQAAIKRLGFTSKIAQHDVIVHGGFIGQGYGVPTPDGAEAIRLTACCEGIFLDPTYTGKAMAGFLAYTRAKHFTREETIVFIHTGGEPALFVGEGSWLYE